MLDLAFLIILIYVMVYANKGIYKETACKAGTIVGLLAAIVGCLVAMAKGDFKFAVLNLIVAGMSFGLPLAARHLVKLDLDRRAEEYEQYLKEQEILLEKRRLKSEQITGYDDNNFDDEELRFGKGGYTDPKL